MTTAFISYSSPDFGFANRIATELEKFYDKDSIWIDRKRLQLTEDWWAAIRNGIESGDNFILIVSPKSLSSPVCHLEIRHAYQLRKRILFLKYGSVDRSQALEEIKARVARDEYVRKLLGDIDAVDLFDSNWLLLSQYQQLEYHHTSQDEEQYFLEQVARLHHALELDLTHVRQHTRLTQKSREWLENGRNSAFHLFGDDITMAEKWLADWEGDQSQRARLGELTKQPEPTQTQREFISASRHAERERALQLELLEKSRLRSERTSRRARRILAVVTVLSAVILAIVAAITSNQVSNAQREVQGVQPTLRSADSTLSAANAQVAGVQPTLVSANATLDTISTQVADAESLRLAALAESILNQDDISQEIAGLLAIRAVRATPNERTLQVLKDTASQLRTVNLVQPATTPIEQSEDPALAIWGDYVLIDHVVWNFQTRQEVYRFETETAFDVDVNALSAGNLLAAIGGCGVVQVWDVDSIQPGQMLYELDYNGCASFLTFSSTMDFLAIGGSGAETVLVNPFTGEEIRRLPPMDSPYSAISDDGRFWATADNGIGVSIWDGTTGDLVASIEGPGNYVNNLYFATLRGTRDNFFASHLLAVVGNLGNIHLYARDKTTGSWEQWLTDNTGFGITNQVLGGDYFYSQYIIGVNESQGLQTLVYGSFPVISDSPSNFELVLRGDKDEIRTLAVGRWDINYVATAGKNGVRIWEMNLLPELPTDTEDLIAFACSRIYRDFTDVERELYEITDTVPTCDQFGNIDVIRTTS